VVDTQNGFYLTLSKQMPLKDYSSKEASISVKGHLFAKVVICWESVLLDVIIDSLRLEKTSKIIKSNHQPSKTMPAKPCP